MDTVDFFENITKAMRSDDGLNPLLEYKNYDALSDTLNLKKECPGEWDAIFTWVEQYFKYSIKTSNPNFANRMWSGANTPSMIGEIVVALTNTSSCTYESAPVATIIERYMIDEMLALVGFEKGSGQMTTGSSNSNMISMMVARNRTMTETKKEGLFNQPKMFAFVNEDAHYSFDKAANILGIGTNQLIKVKTDDDGAMIVADLDAKIDQVIQAKGNPFYVCVTLGTTVKGAFDSITDLLYLRNKYGFWLHGDAAWGGGALMSLKLKDELLKDINALDSFTMDFHKMLGSNLMCNFLLLNDKRLLTETCADGDNSYIFRDDNVDSGVSSLQCGRRVDSLKWFLDWKFYGKQGFSDRVENYYALAKFAEGCINDNEALEMISKRASFNVCFRFKVNNCNDINGFTQKLRDTLYKESKAILALANIGDDLIFRLLISNTNMTEIKIKDLLTSIVETGLRLQND